MHVLRASAAPLVALLAATSTFVSAQQSPRSVEQFLGPLHSPRALDESATSTTSTLHGNTAADHFRYWNQIAIDASGLDHTPVAPGETRVFGEQIGPGRSSRAMAIVHIAVFDAVNAILGGYESYTRIARASANASVSTAIAVAAYDTLVAMFPSQAPRFRQLLAADLVHIQATPLDKLRGIDTGRRAAAAILALRAADGSNHPEPRLGIDYIPGSGPGVWRQDPIGQSPVAMGAHWGQVRPFVIRSSSQFRVPAPPPMTSLAYAQAFDEVQRLGGDDVVTRTQRTPDQTEAGIYWAYDGTPSLCAPPRLYNQLATTISRSLTDVSKLARLFALINVAMADAGTAIWESKYHYVFWRPVTGIRESDVGSGPTGRGDGNPLTQGDPGYSPLGAPASNLQGPNFTPPFPAYPSGHAGFGGALFQILRNFFGRDNVTFTFVSDELNGITVGNDGEVRPLRPRTFRSFSQAEEENGQSRIYLGIHWSYDKTQGIAQGRRVANWVFTHAFRPVPR
ncbi:MAG TPA: chloroperoxidase [Vicinamibacteria bacterium]